jgi:hypothetical protein
LLGENEKKYIKLFHPNDFKYSGKERHGEDWPKIFSFVKSQVFVELKGLFMEESNEDNNKYSPQLLGK